MASSEEIEAARVTRVAVRADLLVRDAEIATALQSVLVLLGHREALNDGLRSFHPSECIAPTYIGRARIMIDGSPNLRGLDLRDLAVPVVLP